MREFENIALALSGTSRDKIHAANRAILAAIVSFVGHEDPAAHILLGMSAEAFELVKQLPLREIERLSRLDVPLWKSRFDLVPMRAASGEAKPVLDRDHLVHSLLKSFTDLDLPR